LSGLPKLLRGASSTAKSAVKAMKHTGRSICKSTAKTAKAAASRMACKKKNGNSDDDSNDCFCSDSSASDSDSDYSDYEDNSEDNDLEDHTDDDDDEESDEKLHKYDKDDEDKEDEVQTPPGLVHRGRTRFCTDWFKTNPETDLNVAMLFPCSPKALNPNDCAKRQELHIKAGVLRPKVGGPHSFLLGRNLYEGRECSKWQELQPLLKHLKDSGHEHRVSWKLCCGTEEEQTAMSDPK